MYQLLFFHFCCSVRLNPKTCPALFVRFTNWHDSGFVTFITILLGGFGVKVVPFWPTWGKAGTPSEGLAHYPTDFTRDVLPIPCHSHNDYWRRIPLFDAVHAGCISIEADVWHFGDELYVGHSESALTKNRTFRNLYVNPLMEILKHQNPSTEFVNATKNGVFDVDASQTLILLIDLKTQANTTYPVVEKQLGPLFESGYLTHYDGNKVVQGSVTVVASGETTFDLILAKDSGRHIFFDAPLQDMGEGSEAVEKNIYNITNSYYASASLYQLVGFPFAGSYTEKQKAKMRSMIDGAHKLGLKARYWETPGWPVMLRNSIWNLLLHEGVDMLNADDVTAASHGTWGKW